MKKKKKLLQYNYCGNFNIYRIQITGESTFVKAQNAFLNSICKHGCIHYFHLQDLLEAVVPFDILSDRRKRSKYIYDLEKGSGTVERAKVVQDARIALASLVACEEVLEQELLISTSYVSPLYLCCL